MERIEEIKKRCKAYLNIEYAIEDVNYLLIEIDRVNAINTEAVQISLRTVKQLHNAEAEIGRLTEQLAEKENWPRCDAEIDGRLCNAELVDRGEMGYDCPLCELRIANAELTQELDDIHEVHKKVMEENCPSDEVHCTCVPILRKEIILLEQLRKDAGMELFVLQERAELAILRAEKADSQCSCGQKVIIKHPARSCRADKKRIYYPDEEDIGACIFRCKSCGQPVHETVPGAEFERKGYENIKPYRKGG